MQNGATALVGQRTFELIFGSRPLVDRRTLVVSRNMQDRDDIEIVRDLDDFWRVWQGDLWVVGGASIYEQALPHADELYLTEIEADFGCDQFFPEFSGFQSRKDDALREENGFLYRYRVYRKGTNILVGG